MTPQDPTPETRPACGPGRVLIVGLGNRLMTDDAAGPLAIERLAAEGAAGADAVDGGTCGLALLPLFEDAGAVIAIDAARLGRAPGTVSTLIGAEMDAALGGARSSAHEVALADLMDAAAATVGRPVRRALIAIEPERIGVGLDPTPAVAAAVPQAAEAARRLAQEWRS